MLSPVTLKQFERLKARFSGATISELPSGSALISVPESPLPAGWSRATATIKFIAPAGYPGPVPDCFWADSDLALAGGGQPQASQINTIPETQQQGRWFSWHVTDSQNSWNPNRDELLTYVSIVRDRFSRVQ